MKNLLILLIISLLQVSFSIPDAFQKDFSDALQFLDKQKKVIQEAADCYGQEKAKVISLVCPELIRYSLFRDFFEIKALESLYVNYGCLGADFSIGPFQMKPSFIEAIEQEIKQKPDLLFKFQELANYEEQDEKSIREARVERLKDFDWQVSYAFCFYEIMTINYVNYPFFSEKEQHQFYATAYNYGFDKKTEAIKAWMNEKAFPYGKKFQSEQLAYHEFSTAFYECLAAK